MKPHLFHLPTNEGLLSQYWQVEELWKVNLIANLNSTLKLVTFNGHHYNYEPVVICDMFVFPSNIECVCEIEDVFGHHEKYCPILNASFESDERMYGLNLTTNTAKTNVADEECDLHCWVQFQFAV